MRLQLNEIFDDVASQPTVEARRSKFEHYTQIDATVVPYVQMAFRPEFKITGLPEGFPEGPKGRMLIDKDIPVGMGYTDLRNEVRRFKMFMPNGAAQKLTQEKREYQWARLIEGLHWQEAELITWIKDGELLTHYPFFLEVQDLAGIKIADPANV